MVINTMRRAGAVIWLALAVTQFIPAISVDTQRASLHAEALRNTYPRPEGSRGEESAFAYIISVLDRVGADYIVRDFSGMEGAHSFSRVVDVTIPGQSEESFLVISPVNHEPGAGPDEDHSASLGAVLALVEAVSAGEPLLTHRLVFAGADSGGRALGTRLFLSDFFPDTDVAALYLAANEPRLVLESGGGGFVAPSWLPEMTVDSARAAGATPILRAGLNQLHRIGLSTAEAPLVALLEARVPAMYAGSQTGEFGPAALGESAATLAAFLEALSARLEPDIRSDWDRHYLYFRLGRRQLVISETIYLLILVGVLFLSLLYALIARAQLGRYLRTIARNFWNLPVLFVLIFAFLSAGTLLLELFLFVRRFPALWQFNPMAYVALKIVLSLLLFSLAAQLLRRLPLAKNGSFYSASALFVLFIDIILFSVLNLSFSYYFVWGFLFSFLFSIARNRWVKMLALLLSPVFIILAAIQILAVPELAVTEVLLLSPSGNLILSFVTLPFLLMLIRLDFLIRHPVAGKRSFALRSVTITTAVLTVALLAFIFVTPPFDAGSPQTLTVTERVDYESFTRELAVTSSAPLGDFSIDLAGETVSVSTRSREWRTSVERIPDILSLRLSTADFLDRNQARLQIDSPLPLESVSIRFSSDEPMTIYDVDYPYQLSPDRLSATIFVGPRPDLPLVINYTTTRTTAPRIEVSATSSVLPDPVKITRPMTAVDTVVQVRSVLNP